MHKVVIYVRNQEGIIEALIVCVERGAQPTRALIRNRQCFFIFITVISYLVDITEAQQAKQNIFWFHANDTIESRHRKEIDTNMEIHKNVDKQN